MRKEIILLIAILFSCQLTIHPKLIKESDQISNHPITNKQPILIKPSELTDTNNGYIVI
jgi:hypothetical protein